MYSLHEGHYRGFFSNLTTILTCSRHLVTKCNVALEDIYIGSQTFCLYGNPKFWFDESVISDQGNSTSALLGFDLSQHPTNQELDLSRYLQRFTWNNRISRMLNQHNQLPANTLGIHYRGTDHNIDDNRHGTRVNPETFINYFHRLHEIHAYNAVFICSDEQDTLEYLTQQVQQSHQIPVFSNQATRLSQGFNQGLHWKDMPGDKVKIADEVILDVHCLSQCTALLGKTSNLINVARILNPRAQAYYVDLPFQGVK